MFLCAKTFCTNMPRLRSGVLSCKFCLLRLGKEGEEGEEEVVGDLRGLEDFVASCKALSFSRVMWQNEENRKPKNDNIDIHMQNKLKLPLFNTFSFIFHYFSAFVLTKPFHNINNLDKLQKRLETQKWIQRSGFSVDKWEIWLNNWFKGAYQLVFHI